MVVIIYSQGGGRAGNGHIHRRGKLLLEKGLKGVLMGKTVSPDEGRLTKMKQLTSSVDELLRRIEEIERENSHLKSLLLTDELTGLYNKRFFYVQLEVETARTRRTGQPCTLMMLDIDDFKAINDTLGHDAGDRLLVQLGGIIWQNLRPTDFACRFGGDEIAVIMPSSNLTDSVGVAKRIRTTLFQPGALLPAGKGQRLSASFGLATYEPYSSLSVDEFFKEADLELYGAKKAGKNQICCGGVLRIEKSAVSEAEKAALFGLMTDFGER